VLTWTAAHAALSVGAAALATLAHEGRAGPASG